MGYFDPPEYEEGPTCAKCEEGYGEEVKWADGKILYRCDNCSHEWEEDQPKEDHEPFPELEPCEHGNDPANCETCWQDAMPKLCPHGNEWHECDACLEASDRAYDEARERAFR